MTFMERAGATLRNGTPQEKAKAIWAMKGSPNATDDIVAALEGLLDDRTIVQMYIPYRYGELRFLVADVLASLRGRQENWDPVVLKDTFHPKTADKLGQLFQRAGIPEGALGSAEMCAELLARGIISREDVVFDPREDLE